MRCGVLGGTFDPVHQGHLIVGRQVLERIDLDEILLMVSKIPPHKKSITDSYHRYAMAALATNGIPDIRVSGLELHRSGPSYTVQTLEILTEKMPDVAFAFVAGSDSLREIHLWKEYGKLFTGYSLVFVQRRGAEVDLNSLKIAPEFKRSLRILGPGESFVPLPGHSCLVELDTPDISSSAIRSSLRQGEVPAPGSLHPSVLFYIQKYRLYGEEKENR